MHLTRRHTRCVQLGELVLPVVALVVRTSDRVVSQSGGVQVDRATVD